MGAKGSELKRVRQPRRNNLRNRHYKTMMKTSMKKVLSSTSKEDASPLKDEAFKIIDKIASKGVIHKNKAANQKSRVSRHINKLS